MTSSASAMTRTGSYRAVLYGGLVAGVMDISAAALITTLRGNSPFRMLQSIAGGVLGAGSYDGGLSTAILGLAFHFLIAFTAAAVFHVASRSIPFMVRHALVSGVLYAFAVYGFMNFIVLPMSAFPHKIVYTPTVLFIGITTLIVCIGIPIALLNRRFSR